MNIRLLNGFLMILAVGIICCVRVDQSRVPDKRNYYVSEAGSDSAEGSLSAPFRSIDKINTLQLNPGDSVLFKSGDTFLGTLILDSCDSGSPDNSVFIGHYGESKSTIDGAFSYGIFSRNAKHITLKGISVKGMGRKSGNLTDGAFFEKSENLVIQDCEFSGFQHSGLHVQQCRNLEITQVKAWENGFAGIKVSGSTMNDSLNYDNSEIYIAHCQTFNNPGDPTVLGNHSGSGILVYSASGGIIEHCTAYGNGWDMPWTGNGPVGIWIWDCTDFIVQYCLSHHNRTNPVGRDGGGFDFDGGVSNSVMQYNVSYSNDGPGYGLFEFGAAKPWQNNVIRYNISQNDGLTNGGSIGIWKDKKLGILRNCEIYNNTFYNDTLNGVLLYKDGSFPGIAFRNNIFVYSGNFIEPNSDVSKEVFIGNYYWNLKGNKRFAGYSDFHEWVNSTGKEKIQDSIAGLYVNPGLIQPGNLFINGTEEISSAFLSGYMLAPGSPLIGRGLDLKALFRIDPGPHDIAGKIPGSAKGFEPGALEYNGRND